MVIATKNPVGSNHHKSYSKLRLASNRSVHSVLAGLSIYERVMSVNGGRYASYISFSKVILTAILGIIWEFLKLTSNYE
ncbi:hypothetical protein ALT785_470105 [Alteromonas infernus]